MTVCYCSVLVVALMMLAAEAKAQTNPPACASVYQAVKDDSGATVQSDYTTIACTTVPKKFKAISNALNPKITKTVGAPTIKVSGFGFLGGTYTASFVPKKSKTVWIPTRTDGAITVSTEDSDVNIQALCDAILKELGFFSPAMMYTIGSSVTLPSGAVTTTCSTKWGKPDGAAGPSDNEVQPAQVGPVGAGAGSQAAAPGPEAPGPAMAAAGADEPKAALVKAAVVGAASPQQGASIPLPVAAAPTTGALPEAVPATAAPQMANAP